MAVKSRHVFDPEKEKVDDHPAYYWIAIGSVFAAVAALCIAFVIAESDFWIWTLITFALYLAAGIDPQAAGDVGHRFVFGIPAGPAHLGLNLRLLGITTIEREREYKKLLIVPGKSERIHHGDDKEELKPGEVRPVRLTSGPPTDEYKAINPGLNLQITTKAFGTVRWRIKDYLMYLVRVDGDTEEERLAEAESQLTETWIQSVTEEWGTRPIGKIIDDNRQIQEAVLIRLDEFAGPRGIDVYETTVKHPDLGHDLSRELARVGEAEAQRLQQQSKAEGNKYEMERMAEANNTRVKLEADAEARAHLLKEKADIRADRLRIRFLGVTGPQLYAADTAERVIGPRDKVLMGGRGLAEMVASGMSIMDAFKAFDAAPQPDKEA